MTHYPHTRSAAASQPNNSLCARSKSSLPRRSINMPPPLPRNDGLRVETRYEPPLIWGRNSERLRSHDGRFQLSPVTCRAERRAAGIQIAPGRRRRGRAGSAKHLADLSPIILSCCFIFFSLPLSSLPPPPPRPPPAATTRLFSVTFLLRWAATAGSDSGDGTERKG